MRLLEPLTGTRHGFIPIAIAGLLFVSALLLFLAPLAMPPGYSWLSNAISESAAQGLRHAWIARLGFLCFGFAVLWLASYKKTVWARSVYLMQLVFALFMIGTAAFSHKPWLAGVSVDYTEDLLHSITATGMGFAFAFGVVLRFMQRDRNEILSRIFDVIAILAAIALTPIGGCLPSIAGLLQRVMFAVAYLWFAYEAIYQHGSKVTRSQQNT